MPARLSLLAALVFAATAAPVSAQAPTRLVAQRTASASGHAPTGVYAGYYTTDGGSVEVRTDGSALALVAYGAPVAARLAAFTPGHDALDARTEALLDAWVQDDLAPLVEAAAPESRERAAESFEAYRATLVRGHGEAVAASVIATFQQIDGRRATLAQVLFDRGVEWVSFVWDGEALLTVTRGLSPVVLGPVQPAGRDTFEGADATLTFDREADGRVSGLSVGGRLVAVR